MFETKINIKLKLKRAQFRFLSRYTHYYGTANKSVRFIPKTPASYSRLS